VKRLGDLELGDRLYEGAGTFISRAGRLVGLMQDPCQAGHMFLLAVQADNRLTIYHGWGNGTHLALARNLPANVFCEFCGIVQAGITIHDTPDDDEPPAPVSGKKPPTKEIDGGDSPSPSVIAGGISPPESEDPPAAEPEVAACLVSFP
jgi:hypothetical protein